MAARTKQFLDPSKVAEHGQYIFIYANNKNHVIYSLTRAINNKKALKQLPFFGRQTVPHHIRKDVWRPLATVCFPSGVQGLLAYRQLREFRKRHELEWTRQDAETAMALHFEQLEDNSKPQTSFNSLGEKRRYLGQFYNSTQKANCIADLATILAWQADTAKVAAEKEAAEKAETASQQAVVDDARARLAEVRRLKTQLERQRVPEEKREEYIALKKEKVRLVKDLSRPVPYYALQRKYHILNDPRPPAKRGFGAKRGKETTINPPPRMTMAGVRIEWANVLDAQYASTWPPSVKHDELLPPPDLRSRNVHTTKVEPPRYKDKAAQEEEEDQEPALLDPPSESATATTTQHETTDESKPEPAVPEPNLKNSSSMLDRLLHRLKYGSNNSRW